MSIPVNHSERRRRGGAADVMLGPAVKGCEFSRNPRRVLQQAFLRGASQYVPIWPASLNTRTAGWSLASDICNIFHIYSCYIPTRPARKQQCVSRCHRGSVAASRSGDASPSSVMWGGKKNCVQITTAHLSPQLPSRFLTTLTCVWQYNCNVAVVLPLNSCMHNVMMNLEEQ